MKIKHSFKELSKVIDKETGKTLAHEMVYNGHKFTELKILKLKDNDGTTVAHEMASKGYKFTDPEILKLKDNDGTTVAHEMAYYGHKFADNEILKLKDNKGETVEDIINKIENSKYIDVKQIKQIVNSDLSIKDQEKLILSVLVKNEKVIPYITEILIKEKLKNKKAIINDKEEISLKTEMLLKELSYIAPLYYDETIEIALLLIDKILEEIIISKNNEMFSPIIYWNKIKTELNKLKNII